MSYIKEIGIILSYLATLAFCYFFDWKPFGVFFSYVVEIVVLGILYAILRFKDERINPQKYRKSQSTSTQLMAVLGFSFVQFFLLFFISRKISGSDESIDWVMLFNKEALFTFCIILFFYSLQAFQTRNNSKQTELFLSEFLIKVIILTVANLLGFLAVSQFELKYWFSVLSVMVAFRVVMEIYFERKGRIQLSK